jgi:putative ABC transport system permease protein
MLVARQAVQEKIYSVKTSIGNTVSIAPAGVQGFQGGGEPLTNDQLSKVDAVSHVTKVTKTLSDRLTSDTSNLSSAIEAGSFGNRQAGNSGVGFQAAPPQTGSQRPGGESSQEITRTFTPPVIVTGINDLSNASAYGGDSVTYTSGKALDPTKDIDEAVVGKALAEKNKLSVGSTFTAYSKTIKVVGIYDTGNTFSNAGLIMSLSALQRLSSQPNDVTSATATVDSIDNIDAAVTAIESTLGDKADVTNSQESAKASIEPLENVKSISLFSLLGALAAGSVIILLTMMMIVRERRREIGVMKAIGSSNLKTMFQFMSEAVTLTFLGLIVGLAIGIAAASPITNVLVSNSTSSTSQTQAMPRPGSGGPGGPAGFGRNSLTSVRNVKASVGLDILGYGVASAFIIAIVGSALPALFISKIRPAEVMRAE